MVEAMGKTERDRRRILQGPHREPLGPAALAAAALRSGAIWNYFKVAGRTLRREKLYALINITGLSVGMACFILLGLWVKSETEFRSFPCQEGQDLQSPEPDK